MRTVFNDGRLRALVIDDDLVSRRVLSHRLSRLGWDVVEADDVGPATVLAATQSPDVIFGDYLLPGGNGLELFAVLADDADRPLFVLVTGSIDVAGLQGRVDQAADAYLTKPVLTSLLRDCLEKLGVANSPG